MIINTFITQGVEDYAFIQLQKAVSLNSADSDAYLFLAFLYEKKGDTENTHLHLTDSYEKNPKHLETLIKLSQLNLQNKQYETALTYLEKAVEINSQNEEIYNNMGLCYFNQVNISDTL